MGQVKGSGEGAFSPFPLPLSFFRSRTYRKGYYFYSPQSSTVIKSKMAATTILRTRTRFRPPKIRLHYRLIRFRHSRNKICLLLTKLKKENRQQHKYFQHSSVNSFKNSFSYLAQSRCHFYRLMQWSRSRQKGWLPEESKYSLF